MWLKYDRRSDRLLLKVQDGQAQSKKQLDEDLTLQLDNKGNVVEIELMRARRRILEGLGIRVGPRTSAPEIPPDSDVEITVDQEKCMGFGSCVIVAPSVFRLDEEATGAFRSHAKLDVIDEGGADADTITLAAQSCPTNAIILKSRKTGCQIYP